MHDDFKTRTYSVSRRTRRLLMAIAERDASEEALPNMSKVIRDAVERVARDRGITDGASK